MLRRAGSTPAARTRWPCRLTVRLRPLQGLGRGSIPRRATRTLGWRNLEDAPVSEAGGATRGGAIPLPSTRCRGGRADRHRGPNAAQRGFESRPRHQTSWPNWNGAGLLPRKVQVRILPRSPAGGVWCSGNISASKSEDQGSTPCAPANDDSVAKDRGGGLQSRRRR